VVHVRSGDAFAGSGAIHGRLSRAEWKPPSLAYYLQAWAHSRLPKLVVVAEDRQNPVAQLLYMLATAPVAPAGLPITFQSGRFEDDFETLRCASHLVLSPSNLSPMLVGANPNLKVVYAPHQSTILPELGQPMPNLAWSCRARLLTASLVQSSPVLSSPVQSRLRTASRSERGATGAQKERGVGLDAQRGGRTRTAGEVPWTASDMQRLELLLGRNRDGHGAYAHVYEEDERYNFSERPLHSWADCY